MKRQKVMTSTKRPRKGHTVRGHDGAGPSLPKGLVVSLPSASMSGAAHADERLFSTGPRPLSQKQLRRLAKREKRKRNVLRAELRARQARQRRLRT